MIKAAILAALLISWLPGSASGPGRDGAVVLAGEGTPPAVTVFAPSATATSDDVLTYSLSFDEPVTGLVDTAFAVTGSATGCTIGAPSGGGAAYVVSVTGCSEGTVALSLAQGSVVDVDLMAGPVAPVSAPAVTIDRTGPTTSAPTTSLRTGAKVNGWQVPVTFRWAGSDPGGSGVTGYEVERSADEGATWEDPIPVSSASLPSWVWGLGTTVVRVRAIDRAGNVGAWSTGASMAPGLVQQTAFRYRGWWKFFLDDRYSGGCAKKSSTAGSWTKYRFTGHTVGIVTTKGPKRGSVRVYLDGAYVKTLRLHADKTRYRVQVWAYRWAKSGTHTIKIVVVGTKGHPRFDADAITVIG
jgi:hypothetical protein